MSKKSEKNPKILKNREKFVKYIEKTLKISKNWQKPQKI